MSAEDVDSTCRSLEAKGVAFKKRPDEGKMKGIAFLYDPDGYWVEVVKREKREGAPEMLLAQTMLRVRDPRKSVEFYAGLLGMTLVRKADYTDFSNYFLATLPDGVALTEDPAGPGAKAFLEKELYPRGIPVLELTHNHGTEDKEGFSYRNGNSDPFRGFGHVGFLVDDVYAATEAMTSAGVEFKKKPDDGQIKGLAFALDPDGYWVELIKRRWDGPA